MITGDFFRSRQYIVDINAEDAKNHLLLELKLSQDIQVIMDYFAYILLIDTDTLGVNEFSSRHQKIKDGIISLLRKEYATGAELICSAVEGIIIDSLKKDGCLDDEEPYANWKGEFHKSKKPANFHQLLEGALQDPRSRIGRTITYPPEDEIMIIGEMIRAPLAHGSLNAAVLEDYKGLLFILILLFHDIIDPHNYQLNDKYRRWINFIKT